MKVTAILGSPRRNGNTDTLTARLLQGAEDAGHVTETVALRRLTIKPCLGCEQCWKKGPPCLLDDDMLPLYQTIADSDVLVFATPVYWYAPTALMKAFIDRLVPFNRPQGRPLIEGKGAVLVVAYEEEGPEAAEPLVRMFELSFRYLGLRFLHRIVIDRLGPKDAALHRPDALQAAYEAGRALTSP